MVNVGLNAVCACEMFTDSEKINSANILIVANVCFCCLKNSKLKEKMKIFALISF